MKHLIYRHLKARYLLVFIFFIPQLSFSQTDLFDLEPITFDSHSSTLQGYFCQAQGEGLHPTIILLHGSPGGNRDVLGLAQMVPGAGWSYGGGIALTAAANNPSIQYVISITAADIGEIARLARHNEEFRDMFVKEMDDWRTKGFVKSTGREEQPRGLMEDSDKYNLVMQAKRLSDKSILIIGGWQDQSSTLERNVLQFIRALMQEGAESVDKVILDANHLFEGKRS